MAEIDPQMADALDYMRGRAKLREGKTPSGMDGVRRNANAERRINGVVGRPLR